MRTLTFSLLLASALLGVSQADPMLDAELSGATLQEQAFGAAIQPKGRVSHVVHSYYDLGPAYAREIRPSVRPEDPQAVARGQGVRVSHRSSTVERLEFASAAEAQEYALRGLELTGKAIDEKRQLSVDLRGKTLLVVTGPAANSPKALDRIRGEAYRGDSRLPDLIATLGEGAIVLETRLKDPKLNKAIDGAQDAISQIPGAKNPRPGVWTGEAGEGGARSTSEQTAEGVRSVTFASPEKRKLVDALAKTYRGAMLGEITSRMPSGSAKKGTGEITSRMPSGSAKKGTGEITSRMPSGGVKKGSASALGEITAKMRAPK